MAEHELAHGCRSVSFGGGLNSAVGQTHYAASRMDGRWSLDAGVFSRDADTNRQTAEHWHVAPTGCTAAGATCCLPSAHASTPWWC